MFMKLGFIFCSRWWWWALTVSIALCYGRAGERLAIAFKNLFYFSGMFYFCCSPNSINLFGFSAYYSFGRREKNGLIFSNDPITPSNNFQLSFFRFHSSFVRLLRSLLIFERERKYTVSLSFSCLPLARSCEFSAFTYAVVEGRQYFYFSRLENRKEKKNIQCSVYTFILNGMCSGIISPRSSLARCSMFVCERVHFS